MKRKNTYKYRTKKKRKGKARTFALLFSGILLAGVITWIGMNDWNVEQSYSKLTAAVGLIDPDVKETVERETPVHPEQVENEEPTSPKGDKSDDQIATGGELETDTENETDIQEGQGQPSNPAKEGETGTDESATPGIDGGGYIEGQQLPSKPTFVKGILIANKKYPLPSTYAPGEDKIARSSFDQMAAEALLSGYDITAFSTYRSFEYQTSLYDRYVARDGSKAADRYSARPGYSEHQTGLAFDIGETNFQQHWASSSFGDTDAGKWLAMNAHRYGFILRYPEGKENITGYMHESWHFRYVGTAIADEIFKRNITLEEYLEI
jgi:D-alanyl-D-alanine carboxypeptidase